MSDLISTKLSLTGGGKGLGMGSIPGYRAIELQRARRAPADRVSVLPGA